MKMRKNVMQVSQVIQVMVARAREKEVTSVVCFDVGNMTV